MHPSLRIIDNVRIRIFKGIWPQKVHETATSFFFHFFTFPLTEAFFEGFCHDQAQSFNIAAQLRIIKDSVFHPFYLF